MRQSSIRRRESRDSPFSLLVINNEGGPHTPVEQLVADRNGPTLNEAPLRVDTVHCDTTEEDQCHETDGDFQDGDMPLCELNQYPPPSPTLTEDVVAAMYVWTDAADLVADLKEYWADGKGTKRPFCFGNALQDRLRDRARAREKLENTYVDNHCRAQDELRKDMAQPVCPPKPAMPALYYLKELDENAIIPWVWNCESGDEFVSNWEATVQTEEFRNKLMRCFYWWIIRKVCHIVPHCTF
ncbi:hypothetical protein M758_4G005900, partial [Ceratodon purpureus]